MTKTSQVVISSVCKCCFVEWVWQNGGRGKGKCTSDKTSTSFVKLFNKFCVDEMFFCAFELRGQVNVFTVLSNTHDGMPRAVS